jgi:hypothetical protein
LPILCVTIFATAQSTDATISGLVVDPTGRVIPDTEIQVLNEATGVLYTNKTNGAGIYTISILPPGQYRVQVSKVGFKTLIKPDIVLNVQSALALNFTLPLGATSETITVDAGSSIINTTDATVGTVIDRKFVANIPLNGRSFQDLISMTPGVVTQSPQAGSSLGFSGDFSVNGQRTESNYYTVDGVSGNIGAGNGYGQPQSGTGGSLGGSTALGTTQSLISVDALQEFRVQSSTYSAEYGRSPGGQFSLVTRSGRNSFHGGVFNYLRNNFFDANDWFNNYYRKPTPALRQNDFGGTFGGPVWIPRLYGGKNRTFFFVSYEGLRLTQPTAAAIQYVPDTFMRQQAVPAIRAILNAYPIQNGIDYGTSTNPSLAQFIAPYSLPSSINSTSLRIDHTFTSKLSVFFRYGHTPSSTASRQNLTRVDVHNSADTYTVGATSQLSARFTNEFRIGYDRTDATIAGTADGFGGGTPIDLATAMGASVVPTPYAVMYFSISGIGTQNFATPNSGNVARQWNLIDTFSASLGRHHVKAGLDYSRIKSPLRIAETEMFSYFSSTKSILNNTPEIPEVLRFKRATPIFNQTAAFVQDEWRISSSIGVSAGLRWELNPPPREANGNNAYTVLGNVSNPNSLSLAPQGTALWKTTWFNFAPRLGVAWTPHNQPGWETVIRAGGGAFYDSLNQVGALGYQGVGFSTYKIFSGTSLPYTTDQLTFPITVAPPYTSATIYAFPAHVQMPYTLQWNVSLQQALGKAQTLTVSYVGANGRRLIGEQQLQLSKINPSFGYVLYFPAGLTSSYQALQTTFQRSVTHGVQALASYTWSHSLDLGSTATSLPYVRGNSDFDVRNNFQGGLSWDLPRWHMNKVFGVVINDWGLDGRLISRGGFPVSLRGSTYADPSNGGVTYMGLNLVANQPIYLTGSQYPGGRIINRAAFGLPSTGVVGNAPRNFVRGFGSAQINFAARREFHLSDRLSAQFRAEAFNILNHPNFGYVDPTYANATFGQATKMLNQSLGTVASQYQQGGPRSMQFAVKLVF